jgi:alpha-methylacyl-CoA racemase
MGPLSGYRIVEMAGIGPAPMCAMLLADLGADVVVIDRVADAGLGISVKPQYDLLRRGRPSIALDLKQPEAVNTVLRMVEKADGLIEGFRPGVMERLGLGPDVCLTRNPRLVYGRMTGWGQDGPLAHASGHDINYIGLAGVLHAIGREGEPPLAPLNLVGDFGGGALYLAFGVVAALLERERSGQGQVVDAAMVDGAASLMTLMFGLHAAGRWVERRGANLLDSGAPFYEVYETSDGKYVCVGSLEPKFYRELLRLTGLEKEDLPAQHDSSSWAAMKQRFAAIFRTKTREEWCRIMEGSEVCFAPVLSMAEAPEHPHNRHRGTFVKQNGVVQPAPAPRFSRTPGAIPRPPSAPGADTTSVLREWGFSAAEVERLLACGAAAQAPARR